MGAYSYNDREMIQIPNVTLLIVDCLEYNRAKLALDHCSRHIQFGARKILTSLPIVDPCMERIPKISHVSEYSEFMIRKLTDYFTTEFVLVAQWDGFVWNPNNWMPEFLNYDYIGAPWPKEFLLPGVPEHWNVGNGGFSLRSKRLCEFLKHSNDLLWHPGEDVTIGQYNRGYIEQNGFKYAPWDIADRFSQECNAACNMDLVFGVHGKRYGKMLPELTAKST